MRWVYIPNIEFFIEKFGRECSSVYNPSNRNFNSVHAPGWNHHMTSMCGKFYKVESTSAYSFAIEDPVTNHTWTFRADWVINITQ